MTWFDTRRFCLTRFNPPCFRVAWLHARRLCLARFYPAPFRLTWLHVTRFHGARFGLARFGRLLVQRGNDLGAVDVELAIASVRGNPRLRRDDPGIGGAGAFARRGLVGGNVEHGKLRGDLDIRVRRRRRWALYAHRNCAFPLRFLVQKSVALQRV